MLLTLVGTISAMILAIYFMLRRRYLLALVCLACFFALLRPGVVYGTRTHTSASPASGLALPCQPSRRLNTPGYVTPELCLNGLL
jgi:hypothetical protein